MPSKLYKFAELIVEWIEGIGYKPTKQSDSALRNCKFKFKCEQVWEELEKTEFSNVRNCTKCNESVHFIDSNERLLEAIQDNLCVAVRKSDRIYMGSIRPLEEYSRFKTNKDK
jgi:hypothetical protein